MGSHDDSNDNPDVTQDLEIDRICVRFEDALGPGSKPSIEQYLDEANELLRPRLLKELLLLELEHQKGLGNESDINPYLTRFPNNHSQIFSAFAEHARPKNLPETEVRRPDPQSPASSDSNSSASDSLHHGRFIPGTKLAGRYRIVSLLGKGGMGEVYRADDLKLGHSVALKFLPIELDTDPKRLEYFYNEVRLSRQISHPNVCRVYDIGEVDGQHYLSMEYVDGEDLKGLLRRVGRFPKDRGIQVARQLCAGLAAAHKKNVLHRDLKPANVMIDGRGQVRITDFGLATVVDQRESGESFVGTPGYMAPEQLQRGATSVRSDIYSLGLVLYEVFTGQPAHKTAKTLSNGTDSSDGSTPSHPSDLVEEIDASVERTIMRCLEADPQRRPSSVEAVAAALPGGNPLDAALAAGETPSPELVAAAGGAGTITPIRAAVCMGIVLVGLAILAPLRGLTPVNFVTPPMRLVERAENILKAAGLQSDAVSPHVAYGFRYDRDVTELSRSEQQSLGVEAEEFWYRQSPQPLTPFRAGQAGLGVPRLITLQNPPPLLEGMVSMRLSPDGDLRELMYVTEQRTSGGAVRPVEEDELHIPESVWRDLFDHAGLSFDDFTTATPEWRPTSAAAGQFAWESIITERRVEAAVDQGRVVYFQVFFDPWTSRPWTTDRGDGRYTWGPFATPEVFAPIDQGAALVLFVFLAVGIVVARHNVLRRKCDLRGAWRLSVLAFVLVLTRIIGMATHLPHIGTELLVIQDALQQAVWEAFLFWVGYAAIEPYIRRFWPHALVAWSRIMAGRLTDPLVCRDILYGAVGAVIAEQVFAIGRTFEQVPQLYYPVWNFTHTRYAVTQLLATLTLGIGVGYFHTVALLLLRLVLRSQLLAAVGWIALLTSAAFFIGDVSFQAILFTIIPFMLCIAWLLTRFGIVACTAFVACRFLLERFPITSDLSAWYAPLGLFALAAVLAYAVYGCYFSVTGQADTGLKYRLGSTQSDGPH